MRLAIIIPAGSFFIITPSRVPDEEVMDWLVSYREGWKQTRHLLRATSRMRERVRLRGQVDDLDIHCMPRGRLLLQARSY